MLLIIKYSPVKTYRKFKFHVYFSCFCLPHTKRAFCTLVYLVAIELSSFEYQSLKQIKADVGGKHTFLFENT